MAVAAEKAVRGTGSTVKASRIAGQVGQASGQRTGAVREQVQQEQHRAGVVVTVGARQAHRGAQHVVSTLRVGAATQHG